MPVYFGQPKTVSHHNATTVAEATSLLRAAQGEAIVIAGGTDLVHRIKKGVTQPSALVNIKTIPGLDGIGEDTDGLVIGALSVLRDIETSPLIQEKYPILAEAAASVAAPQLRNMATLGGNLCQEVWCWYYRRSPVTGRTFDCRRKGGTLCYAVKGQNSQHAIIGPGSCRGAFPSDMAPALIALSASVDITSPAGSRKVALGDFYTDTGNGLLPDEIITAVRVPSPKTGTLQRFLKFRLRKTLDFAISSVAAAVCIEDGVVKDARLIFGGIAPTPYRAQDAEDYLKGKPITEEVVSAAAALLKDASPLSGNAYKIPITKTLMKRALLE
ncbi:FAD binding domain-containing protein [Chloroflexota bacterium]